MIIMNSRHLNGSITPDSREYMWLAENFTQAYSLDDSTNPYLSFRRTPIYPLFLKVLMQGDSLLGPLIAQQIISLAITCLTWLIAKKMFSEKTAWIAALLTSVETSILTSSFMILSEILFTFIFLTGITTFLWADNFRSRNLVYALSGIFFGVSALIRPIGIGIIIILIVHFIFAKGGSKNRSLITLTVTLIPIIFWSVKSYVSVGVFDVSSIQSHNLHLFEGSGAKAYRLGIPLDEVHAQEKILMNQSIGESFTLIEEQKYRSKRGLFLIFQNFPWFMQMHFVGAVKMLIGPGQGDILSFLTQGRVLSATHLWQISLVGVMLCLTLFIVFSSLIGFFRTFKQSQPLILATIIVTIVISSGIQAYARFRTPIAPLMCIFAAVGIDYVRKSFLELNRLMKL